MLYVKLLSNVNCVRAQPGGRQPGGLHIPYRCTIHAQL